MALLWVHKESQAFGHQAFAGCPAKVGTDFNLSAVLASHAVTLGEEGNTIPLKTTASEASAVLAEQKLTD